MAQTRGQKHKPPASQGQPPVEGLDTTDTAVPVPRKRGRPAKAHAQPSNKTQKEVGSTEAGLPSTRKRGQPAKPPQLDNTAIPSDASPQDQVSVAEDSDDDAPPAKRSRRGATSKATQEPPATVKPRKKGSAAAPRQKAVQPAAKRAGKKDAADKALKKTEEARQTLAEWDVAEEQDDEEMDAESTQRLSAILRRNYEEREPTSTSEGESFDFMEIDSDSDEEPIQPPPQAKFKGSGATKAKKAVRGEVEDLAEELRGDGKGKNGKNDTRFKASDLRPKKYKNSGLESPPKQRPQKKVIGGLEDEDTAQRRPKFPQSPKPFVRPQIPGNLQRDTSRANKIVIVEGSTKPKATARPKATLKSRDDPAVKEKSRTNAPPNLNTKPASESSLKVKQQQAGWMLSNNWKVQCLASITHALWTSERPFTDFSVGSPAFLSTVQEAFDLAFPHIDYQLSANDDIVKTACKRMQNRKSLIGSTILQHYQTIYSEAPFKGKIDTIKNDCATALRVGGAAFFAEPTPDGFVLPLTHPDFVEPKGFLQTDLIVEIATKFLAYAEKSDLEPKISSQNPPIGLYALILTAIDRALTAHLPRGHFNTPEDFKHAYYWKQMQQFVGKVKSLKASRWEEVLQIPMGDFDSDPTPSGSKNEGSLSVISNYRNDIYIPGSPEKR